MSSPCIEDLVCNNGDFMKGKLSKCALCRFSPENVGRDMAHYWSPTPPARKAGAQHAMLWAEKRQAKADKHFNKLREKSNKDRNKRKISRLAQRAEKKTEASIIHATKNSGRRNKDGDHVFAGNITLDTKLQTTRENPVILLGELEKVRSDAVRAGKAIGGLVIRNKHNIGCVVLREEDWAVIMSERANEPAH
jgi:hypothetical protein